MVCGDADSLSSALSCLPRLKPHLVVACLPQAREAGLVWIRRLHAALASARILVVSVHAHAAYASRVLQAGADGCVLKQEDLEEVVLAVCDILSGAIYLSETVLASKPNKAVVKPGKRPPPRRGR